MKHTDQDFTDKKNIYPLVFISFVCDTIVLFTILVTIKKFSSHTEIAFAEIGAYYEPRKISAWKYE
jgi:hypothetical protein